MQMDNAPHYHNFESFINATRAKGRYSFSKEEAQESLRLFDKALNQVLFRYSAKRKIAKVRSGFYAIIPPEYSHRGMLPPNLFIDHLMKSLEREYYVAMFSAAAYYGAAHQQPMTYYVITKKTALRNVKNDKLNLDFYVKKDWHNEDVVQKKSDVGYFNVSSPELTALDLLAYSFSIGRVFTVLEELVEEMTPDKLNATAQRFSQTATLQRLGYLLDKEINNQSLSDSIREILKGKKLSNVPLMKGEKMAEDSYLDREWKVIKNVEIESDL